VRERRAKRPSRASASLVKLLLKRTAPRPRRSRLTGRGARSMASFARSRASKETIMVRFGMRHIGAFMAAVLGGSLFAASAASAGVCAQALHGNGNTIYYPSGHTMTSNAGIAGATWYYDSGHTMTSNALRDGATVYYDDGHTLSSAVGTRGATWYWDDGHTMTSNAGVDGATWYDRDGSVLTSDGPELSDDELWEQACAIAIEGAGPDVGGSGGSNAASCFAAIHGHGETLYYANGHTMTSNAGRSGATWYYPDGHTMTSNALVDGATLYYDSGHVFSSNLGRAGATWYWDNGDTMTSNAGVAGATWYNENGSVLTSSGAAMTSGEMWSEACRIALGD
jgi:hypothetical protein